MKMYRPQITLLARERGHPFLAGLYAFKARAQEVIAKILPEPQGSLFTGILLGVESGIPQKLLEDFDYELWPIHKPFETPNDVPTENDLLPYDLVIWSCPLDSPGYISAWEALAAYLDAGGRLFLTGQDIGYWDDGEFPFTLSPQYRKYLKASYVTDDAGTHRLTGTAGEILEGLTVIIEGGDGADNQLYLDEIAVAEPDHQR